VLLAILAGQFASRKIRDANFIRNGLKIPRTEEKYFVNNILHLDRRLNWRKRKQLGIQLSKMYRLLGIKSQLSIENKLLLYKAILKPIWAYGVQLAQPPTQM